MLTPSTRLGLYEILGPLGAGGMGEVYRARDTRLKRDIAIKLLPQDVASSPERIARFEREATTVAGLNHPNIVTLQHCGRARSAWLERAYAQRDGGLYDLNISPHLRPLHSDPRWSALVKKMGFTD